jgi:raffinose/stachyose/melibiose transport system permease protein
MKNKIGKYISGLIVLAAGVVYIFPVFLIVMNAFKKPKDLLANFISFPTSFYLENFKEAFRIMNYWVSFKNTMFVTIVTVILSILLSFCCAYGISHLKGRLSNVLYMTFVLGEIIPFYTVMITISVLATKTHMTNNLLGLVVLYCGFFSAFGVLLFTGFLKTIPKELEEAALLDGCGIFRTMTQVIFPILLPATYTAGVLFFLWTWNDFLMPSILIGDNRFRTITVNLYMFRTSTHTEWNLFIAGMVLSMIPIIIVYFGAQKYITSGLTAGAIKS